MPRKLVAMTVACMFGLALPALAQWQVGGGSTGFSGRSQGAFISPPQTRRSRGYSTGPQQQGPGVLSIPTVMPVAREHRRAPAKPVFSLGKDEVAKDKRLQKIDGEIAKLLPQMRLARKRRDMAAASRLLRSIETLRQKRLQRLREIAPPKVVVPEPARGAAPKMTDSSTPAPSKPKTAQPILPLPKRPDGDRE